MAVERIAFVGWNAFQLQTFAPLLERLPNSSFLLERRTDPRSFIPEELRKNLGHRIQEVDSPAEREGEFDVLVCQTLFSGIERVEQARIAMLQYGYAKSAHNFGAWRALADLNLTYGVYAAERIGKFSATSVVGVPKYDFFQDGRWRQRVLASGDVALNPAKKTVLFAPTWGELCSITRYRAAIVGLAKDYNVVFKRHHLITADLDIPEPVISFSGADDLYELLAKCDVFVGDYGGSIFDALLCNKPVVLLDLPYDFFKGDKTEQNSLELSRREEIGIAVSEPEQLKNAVDRALFSGGGRAGTLRDDLFRTDLGALDRAVAAIVGLANKPQPKSDVQRYVAAEVRARLRSQAEHHRTKASQKRLRSEVSELKARLEMTKNPFKQLISRLRWSGSS